MLIVSTGEFRGKQKSYLDKVDNGTELIIQRSKNRSYKIVPVEEDDTLMTKEEFFARIDRARSETGGIVITNQEELEAYLDSL